MLQLLIAGDDDLFTIYGFIPISINVLIIKLGKILDQHALTLATR